MRVVDDREIHYTHVERVTIWTCDNCNDEHPVKNLMTAPEDWFQIRRVKYTDQTVDEHDKDFCSFGCLASYAEEHSRLTRA